MPSWKKVVTSGSSAHLNHVTASGNISGSATSTGSFGSLVAAGNVTVTGTVDGRDLQTDGTKLDGIEASATADQTAAEIKTLVGNASDSNVFTDADHTKLNNIEASADVTDTANVTAAGALMDSEVDADIKTLVLPASTTISAFGRTLIDDAAASNARTTLGLGSLSTLSSIDISSNTNLVAGTNITLSGDTLNVDDAFLKNNADDTTSGTITAAGFISSGNVGIGETSPDELLHIKSSTSSKPVIKLENAGDVTNGAQLHFVMSTTSEGDNDIPGTIRFKGMNSANAETEFSTIYTKNIDITDGTEDSEMHFRTMANGTLGSTMMIQSDKVGIGITSPTHTLHVKGPGNTNQNLFLITDSDDNNQFRIDNSSADGSPHMRLYDTSGASKVVFSSNGDSKIMGGNVGIGTDSPDKLLHLYQTGNNANLLVETDNHSGIQIKGGNSHDRYVSFMQANGSVGGKIGWDHSSQVIKINAVDSFASTHLVVDVNGKVGIGTTSPKTHLDIQSYQADGITIGADNDANRTRTNSTSKSGGITGVHYTNAEESIRIIGYSSTSDANNILIGGGNGDWNAATKIDFYTAANFNTTAGTKTLTIAPNTISGSAASTGSFGELIVAGNITAQQYIVSASTTYMTTSFSDGNTKFGDSSGDVHQFTGSFKVKGSILTNDSVTIGSEEIESNFSSSIAGRVNTIDAAGSGVTISNNSNNRILTGDGSNANAESALTFDGAVLGVTSSANSPSPKIQLVNTNTSQVSGSRIEFYRNKTHNSGDEIGAIDFFHKNTNIEKIRYASIDAGQYATVNGSEGGFFSIRGKTTSVANDTIGLMQFTGSGYGILRLGDHRTLITGSSNSTTSFGKIVGDTFHGDGSSLTNITAATATTATNVTLTANNTNNETVYLTFADGVSGTQGLETDSALSYNPSTDTLTAVSMSGNSNSATRATNIAIGSTNNNTTFYPTFVSSTSGNRAATVDSGLTYNPGTNILTAGTFSGTATVATTATNVTIGSSNNNSTFYPVFASSTSGDRAPTVDSGLTYNPGTNILTAGTFSGTATVATTTNNLTIGSSNNNTTFYPVFASATSGDRAPTVDSGLTYNPGTNVLTAGTFSGTATTAQTASNVALTANNSSNETVYLTFADGASGTQALETDSSLSYNPATNTLTAGTLSGTATTANTAANVSLTSNNSANETTYITFADGTSGAQGLETDSSLSYNPATNTLTAGTLSGTATNATTATNVTATANNSTNESTYIAFVDGASGAQGIETDSTLRFNPSTNTLSATNFSGTVSTATIATTVAVTSNASTNENNYITFVDASAGGNTVEYDSTLRYNPNSNALTASILRATNDVIVDDDLYVGGGLIDLKNTGTRSLIRMYCESSNAHYVGLQAPAHSDFSGNVAVTLPATATTLIGRNTTDTLTNKTIGQNLLPDGDNTRDLGSANERWANLFTGDLHLSNEGGKGNDVDKTTGDWTIQEGEDDLYLFNNKSGKKYKFKLEEL